MGGRIIGKSSVICTFYVRVHAYLSTTIPKITCVCQCIHQNSQKQKTSSCKSNSIHSEIGLSTEQSLTHGLDASRCHLLHFFFSWFLISSNSFPCRYRMEPVTKLISIKNNWIGGAKGISRAEARQNDKIMGFLVAQMHKQGHKKYMWFIT
jgi:hypothetical protein